MFPSLRELGAGQGHSLWPYLHSLWAYTVVLDQSLLFLMKHRKHFQSGQKIFAHQEKKKVCQTLGVCWQYAQSNKNVKWSVLLIFPILPICYASVGPSLSHFPDPLVCMANWLPRQLLKKLFVNNMLLSQRFSSVFRLPNSYFGPCSFLVCSFSYEISCLGWLMLRRCRK